MKVKIKTWDKMVDEFGVNLDGAVNCRYTLTAPMEEEMPKDRIIDVDIRASGCMMWYGWRISDEMIEERLGDNEIQNKIQEREVPQHILDYWMSQSDDVSSLQTAKIELQREVEKYRIAIETKASELALLTQLLNRNDDAKENSTSEATRKESNYMERVFIESLEIKGEV